MPKLNGGRLCRSPTTLHVSKTALAKEMRPSAGGVRRPRCNPKSEHEVELERILRNIVVVRLFFFNINTEYKPYFTKSTHMSLCFSSIQHSVLSACTRE